MADRSVKITVGANVAPLKAAMADGSKSVEGLTAKTTTLGSRLKNQFSRQLSFAAVTGGMLSLGAAIKGTFSLGLNFTEQLNTLQAVSGATAEQMAKVSAKARALGNDVEIPATSASDAAEAMTELAKGGLSVQQAMDAAKGTLQLAAAAQVSGAQAAQIQANALNTFGLKATDAGHVADVLANTANAASGEITDFAQAMQQSGSVAKLFGISIDDTATALGLFANNGVKGSDAGTSLKTMLTQLATPSAKAKDAMKDLNLQVYDGQGKFVGLRSLTEQLSAAQGRMSQAAFQSAAGIVFGSDAIRGASILASGGVSAYDKFRSSVERVGGAADLANAKMKGLPGAFQQAQNAIQDVALQLYDALAPTVERVVRGFTDAIPKIAGVVIPVFSAVFSAVGTVVGVLGTLLGAVDALPGPIKTFALALAGVAIANKVGLLGKLSSAFGSVRGSLAGFSGAWSRISDDAALAGVSKMRVGLGLVGGAAKSAGASLLSAFGGPWGVALAAAPLAIDLLGKAFADARPKVTDFSGAINENTGALTANAATASARALQDAFKPEMLKAYGLTLGDVTKAVMQGGAAYEYAKSKIDAYQVANQRDGLAIRQGDKDLGQLRASREQYTDAIAAGKDVLEASTAAQKAAAAAQKAAAAAAKDATKITAGYTDAQDEAKSQSQRNAVAYQAQQFATSKLGQAQDDARSSAGKLKAQWDVLAGQIGVSKMARETSARVLDAAKAMQEAHDKAHDLTGQASQLEAELARLSGRNVSVEEATRAFNGALQQMRDAARDANGNVKMLDRGIVGANGSINTATKSGQDLYDNVTAIGKAAQDTALAQAELAGKTRGQKAAEDAAAKSLAASREQFIKNAHQMGLTADQAKRLADRYFGIPKNIKTVIKGDFTDVDHKIQALRDTQITIDVTGAYRGVRGLPARSQGGAMPGLATGGPALAGRDYLVGEKGPEILRMPAGSDGWVFNNAQTQRMMASGPAVTPRADGGAVSGPGRPGPIVVEVLLRGDGVITDAMAREAGVQIAQHASRQARTLAGVR